MLEGERPACDVRPKHKGKKGHRCKVAQGASRQPVVLCPLAEIGCTLRDTQYRVCSVRSVALGRSWQRPTTSTMNFAKIGVQGYSLGNLQLNSDELIWTSSDKSRQERNEIQNSVSPALVLWCCVLAPLLRSTEAKPKKKLCVVIVSRGWYGLPPGI